MWQVFNDKIQSAEQLKKGIGLVQLDVNCVGSRNLLVTSSSIVSLPAFAGVFVEMHLAGLSPLLIQMICALFVEAYLIIKQSEFFTLLERLLGVYGLFAMSLCSKT